ncbi:MAG: RNA polymerase sigma factor (sigma-70 family) [Flavobacteriales bacterium]|jgi:RNA polymerase sigma factor (sigma-70 family)
MTATRKKVYHKSISFVKDLDLAQEVIYDIFLKVILNLSMFNHKSKFSTWLYSLVYNFCNDYLRKSNKVRTEFDATRGNIPDNEDDRNERELLSLSADRLATVLDLINHDDKAVLLMKYQNDGSVTFKTDSGKIRVDLTIGVSLNADFREGESVLTDGLQEYSCAMTDPDPILAVSELGDSSVNLAGRSWCNPVLCWDRYFDIIENSKLALDSAGISISFPQSDVNTIK